MLSKMTLKLKLVLLTVVMIVISGVIGGSAYVGLQKVRASYAVITDSSLINIVLINRMETQYMKFSELMHEALKPSSSYKEINDQFVELKKVYEKADKDYQDVPFLPGEDEVYKPVAQAWKPFEASGVKIIEMLHNSTDKSKIAEFLDGEFTKNQESYEDKIKSLIEFNQSNASRFTQEAQSYSTQVEKLILSLLLLGAIFGLAVGNFFAVWLSKALSRISDSIADGANTMSGGSSHLATASEQLSSGATEAAASLEETVASIEELTSIVKQNSLSAGHASNLSQGSRDSAERGGEEVNKLIQSMGEIAEGAKKIKEIISIIDDIAFQTNLLALNAAVEAARAGEQGKGFAVVAEAVRSLAQKSADAAKEISSLIQDNVAKSERGSFIAKASGEALNEILTSTKKVADLNGEIAAGGQEQSTGLEQISKAMNQLDQATQGNAASSEEVAASAEQMSSQAQSLRKLSLDLRVLVHGAEVGTEAKDDDEPGGKTVPRKIQSTISKQPTVPIAKKVVGKSMELIPFDDDDSVGSDRKIGNVSGF